MQDNFEPRFFSSDAFRGDYGTFAPIYNGLRRTWIGGVDGAPGDYGVLYGEYSDGSTVRIGNVIGPKGDQGDIATAVVTIAYRNSDNGTTPPSGSSGWSASPNPQPGEFTWTRTIYNWNNGSVETIYNVVYSGQNGRVLSVNATDPDQSGNVDIASISDEDIANILV